MWSGCSGSEPWLEVVGVFVTAREKRPQSGSIMSICKLRIQSWGEKTKIEAGGGGLIPTSLAHHV
jgi:hypothetical protein